MPRKPTLLDAAQPFLAVRFMLKRGHCTLGVPHPWVERVLDFCARRSQVSSSIFALSRRSVCPCVRLVTFLGPASGANFSLSPVLTS